MPNNLYRPSGPWEYEMFTEILTLTRYPEKKIALIHPNASLHRGRVLDDGGALSKLIDKAARNLLQRVSAQGWEPVDALDAESLLAKGRVRYEAVPGFWARTGQNREIEPTTVSIFCRRWVTNRSYERGKIIAV
jgi:hypothetical protein